MTLRTVLRGTRAATTMLAIAALAVSPAAADAASKTKHAKAPKKASVTKPAAAATGLGSSLGLGPTMQLAAMNTAIKAADGFYAGRTTGCKSVTPVLASQGGQIIAGNFRDSDGYCYVWLNLQQSSMLTGSEICKTTLHEMGHLTGLQHSQDPGDVMFAPFRSDPIPAPCLGTTRNADLHRESP